MEKINDLFDAQIAKTIDAYPSVFSKDDVVTLLSSLRTESLHVIHEMLPQPNTHIIDEELFQEFNWSVRRSLGRFLEDDSIIDYESAEFNISYGNRIELESVTFDTDSILDRLEDILSEEFKHFYDNSKANE